MLPPVVDEELAVLLLETVLLPSVEEAELGEELAAVFVDVVGPRVVEAALVAVEVEALDDDDELAALLVDVELPGVVESVLAEELGA